jgi:hypothetical protein
MARWIEGTARSGKTSHLVSQFQDWTADFARARDPQVASQGVLVLAMDGTQRRLLVDRLSRATAGKFPVTAATPLSFIRQQVRLYWILIVRSCNLKAQFPIPLRVEHEQSLALGELAIAPHLETEGARSRAKAVRRLLDLFLLASLQGQDLEGLAGVLERGLGVPNAHLSADALGAWRDFCLHRGLLTYGLEVHLFAHVLLPSPLFREQMVHQYRYLLADDVDEFPAVLADFCQMLLESGAPSLLTFNPQGGARRGLGADPAAWSRLASQCILTSCTAVGLGAQWGGTVVGYATDAAYDCPQVPHFYRLEAASRSRLLRWVASEIAALLASGMLPEEIAIIAPGLDAIASYALPQMLAARGTAVRLLSDPRPLVGSPHVRALLALLRLKYGDETTALDPDEVTEMLAVLLPELDLVRAGMLATVCFVPHRPQLLPYDVHPQWYRLSHRGTVAYEHLRQWLSRQARPMSPLLFLDRAIQQFLRPQKLPYPDVAQLQTLLETAQSHWQLGYRLGWPEAEILERFTDLIQQGTVAANPLLGDRPYTAAVTLASIFQYRSHRLSHRCHFWLDIGSNLWQQGGTAVLYGAPVLQRSWNGHPWDIAQEKLWEEQRLRSLLDDLLHRAGERVYFCYGELDVQGRPQEGALRCLLDLAQRVPSTTSP